MEPPTTSIPAAAGPLRSLHSEPALASVSKQQQQEEAEASSNGTSSSSSPSRPIQRPRRSRSALPRLSSSASHKAAGDGDINALPPLLMLTRLSSGPGVGISPCLLPDPPALKARLLLKQKRREAAAAALREKELKEGQEAAEEGKAAPATPTAAAAAVAAEEGGTGKEGGRCRFYFLMACASALPLGAVAGKMAVMAASVRLMHHLRISHKVYGMLVGAPSFATVAFSPFGGLAVDRLGADNAAAVFALVCFLGCTATALGAGIHSVPLVFVGQLCLGLGKAPLGVAQLVYLRLAAGPEGAGSLVAVANIAFHLAGLLAFAAFPPLADAIGHDKGGDVAPLVASAMLAFVSFLGALPLRGQLGEDGAGVVVEGEKEECAGLTATAAAAANGHGGRQASPYSYSYSSSSSSVSLNEDKDEAAAAAGAARAGAVLVTTPSAHESVLRPLGSWRPRLLHTLSHRSSAVVSHHPPTQEPAAAETAPASTGTVLDPGALRLLLLAMCCFYGSTLAFESFAVPFLMESQGHPPQRAAASAALFEVGSIVLGPLVGRLADWDLQPSSSSAASASASRRKRWWWRWRRPPPGTLQLAASTLGALGILLPYAHPPAWPAGFLLASAGIATAGVAYWLTIPLFVCQHGLGRAVGTAMALDEAGVLVNSVVVGVLVDRAGGGTGAGGKGKYRTGALPFLLGVACLGTTASALVVPRIALAVNKGQGQKEEEEEEEGDAAEEADGEVDAMMMMK